MAITLISSIDEMLEKDILPTVQKFVFKDTALLDQISKDRGVQKLANNTFYVTAQTAHHSGVQYVAENTALVAGRATYEQLSIPAKYGFGHFELTDQAIQATKNDKAALQGVIEANAQSLKLALSQAKNRILWGDGTGQLTLANGPGVASTTVTVDSTDDITVGMQVVIGSNSAVEVSTVTSSTVFTIASALTWGDNNVVKTANADEPMGLKGIIDDGDHIATIQGIVRSSNPFTVSFTDDTAESLSESDMIAAHIQAQKYGSRKKIWFMGPTLYLRYGSLLTAMKKTADTKEVLSGGWKGLEFMDSGVILDYKCPDGFAVCVDLNEVTIGQMTPLGWLQNNNGGILTRVTGYANYQGTMRDYWNTIGLNFRAHARLSNKTA